MPPDESLEAREIARALAGALEPALAPGTPGAALAMARDVAQMLALEGLDRALQGLERHAGDAWPEPFAPLLERVAALREAALAAGTIEPFQRADLELAGLAAEVEALEWAPGTAAGGPPAPTLAATEALEGVAAPDDLAGLARTRLSAPVAAALRAALDWLGGAVPRRPLRVRAEDSVLEVWVAVAEPTGLRAASEVLGAVEGSLGPVDGAAPAGTWRLRVPAQAPRPAFLMVLQGGVHLALPWHAVLHVHMLPAADVADARPAAPVLAPLAAPDDAGDGERPVVMVAHGLRRAWLVADRLVWRFPADPCDPPAGPPAPALAGTVRTDEGETWWRVDVARLLSEVEPLAVPDLAAPRALPAPEPPPVAPPAEAEAPWADPGTGSASTSGEGARAHAGTAAWAPEVPEWTEIDDALALLDESPTDAPAADGGHEDGAPDVPAPAIPAPPAPAPHAAREAAGLPPPRRELLVPGSAAPLAPAPATAPAPPGPGPGAAPAAPASPPAVASAPHAPRPATAPAPPVLRVLRAGEVVALPAPPPRLDARAVTPTPAPPGAPPVAEAPPTPLARATPSGATAPAAPRRADPDTAGGAAAAAGMRRALVAEDSLMARVFLTRLLERRGFETHGVGTAAELVFALARGPWALVCVDVELPDARGAELVRGVRDHLARRGGGVALMALVRDAEDASAARAAGVAAHLRKPFDESELDAALAGAGLAAPR
jgi:CheY-like chemotaxis protein